MFANSLHPQLAEQPVKGADFESAWCSRQETRKYNHAAPYCRVKKRARFAVR